MFSTRIPYGDALPPGPELASYPRGLIAGGASVANIVVNAVTQEPRVSISVASDGAAGELVLYATIELGTIAGLMDRIRVPDGWSLSVLDGNGRIISANRKASHAAGEPQAIAAMIPSDLGFGTFHTHTPDGAWTSVFRKIPGTWAVNVSMPRPRPLAVMDGRLAGLAAAAIGLALLITLLLGRRLQAAMEGLSAAAEALKVGQMPPPPTGLIAEFAQVGLTLHHAAKFIRAEQDALAAARERAERSETSKSRFLAAAGHDLRQPLQAFGLFLELLRNGEATAAQRALIQQLCNAHEKMSRLTNALLDMAKLEADGVALSMSDVDLADLLADIGAECRPQAEAKGLRLRVHAHGPARMTTDALVLGRMVRNLVHNALRYTTQGGVLLALRRRSCCYQIESWDTGIGIPADKLVLIEFYQIGNTDRDHDLGLGLAIVARLAGALDMPVSAVSRPGRGSLFRVHMSRAEAFPFG